MAKLLVSAALGGLVLSGAALAQPTDNHSHGPAPAQHAAGPPTHHGRPAPQARHANPLDHRPAVSLQAAPQSASRTVMRAAPVGNGQAMAMHGPAPSGHNFSSYQRNVTAQHRFRAPAYQRPQGWYSRRWTFGESLPALFWTQNFWIGDYVDYGLMPPPPGTIWIRDGNDALLIDRADGEIIQVDYGVFY